MEHRGSAYDQCEWVSLPIFLQQAPENTVGMEPLLIQQLSCKASDRLYVYALFKISDKED